MQENTCIIRWNEAYLFCVACNYNRIMPVSSKATICNSGIFCVGYAIYVQLSLVHKHIPHDTKVLIFVNNFSVFETISASFKKQKNFPVSFSR